MKKLSALVLALILTLALAACGSTPAENTEGAGSSESVPASEKALNIAVENEVYPFITTCHLEPEAVAEGTVVFLNYSVSDEEFLIPKGDGYEWRFCDVMFTFPAEAPITTGINFTGALYDPATGKSIGINTPFISIDGKDVEIQPWYMDYPTIIEEEYSVAFGAGIAVPPECEKILLAVIPRDPLELDAPTLESLEGIEGVYFFEL